MPGLYEEHAIPMIWCVRVARRALETGASVHMPRIGCGLAGGKWEHIAPLIEKTLCENGVAVWVYDPSAK